MMKAYPFRLFMIIRYYKEHTSIRFGTAIFNYTAGILFEYIDYEEY